MEFETFNLTDLYTISSGLSKNRKYFGTGTPFLTFKDVFDNLILPNEFSGQVITEEKEREKYSVKKGDLFLTRTSEKQNELGISAVALKDYKNATFNGFTKRLRPNKYCENKLLPVYAAFYFRSNNFRNQVNSMSIMSTRASLNNEMISKLKITIPSLQNQMKISHILLALLKKEKINQKIIAILEELSQTLFKHWFVDFEFPDENGNPYKSSGGEMIDSELGEMPLSWKVHKLNDIFKINYGKNLPTKKILNTGYPVFGGNGIIGYYSSYMYENPKILISCRGAASGKIHISKEKSFVTNNSIVLNEKQKNYFYYFKELFKYNDFKRYTTGSAQPQITIANIKDLMYLTPDTNIIDQFNSKISSLFNQKNNYEDENQNLTQLRDTLLPKLMSGEIEIPDDIEVNEDELSI